MDFSFIPTQYQDNYDSQNLLKFTPNTLCLSKSPEDRLLETPVKEKDDTEGTSYSNSENMSFLSSSGKKKVESFLSKEFLLRLDECSPVKLYNDISICSEDNKEEKKNEFLNEKNYLIENYETKEEDHKWADKKKLIFGNENPKTSFENHQKKFKHKNFKGRDGDWECLKCKNLNFAFRKVCNKCGVEKNYSEKQKGFAAGTLLKMLDSL